MVLKSSQFATVSTKFSSVQSSEKRKSCSDQSIRLRQLCNGQKVKETSHVDRKGLDVMS